MKLQVKTDAEEHGKEGVEFGVDEHIEEIAQGVVILMMRQQYQFIKRDIFVSAPAVDIGDHNT